MDWDVIDSLGHIGGIALDTRSAWVGMPGGPVFGMALVGDTPAANITVVDNFEYVYPVSHVINIHKYQLLNGTIHQPVADHECVNALWWRTGGRVRQGCRGQQP